MSETNEVMRQVMRDTILISNKLTAPKIAFGKLAKGERVPKEFLELAAKELSAAVALEGEKIIAFLAEDRYINNQ